MENLYVEATEYLPLIDFALDGRLKLEGKAIPEDAARIFNPLINFIEALEVDHVVFDINLYYFNTSTSRKLIEMLRQLDANTKINHIRVNWHYEEGDEDSLETAEVFEECLFRTEFRYIEYAEVA